MILAAILVTAFLSGANSEASLPAYAATISQSSAQDHSESTPQGAQAPSESQSGAPAPAAIQPQPQGTSPSDQGKTQTGPAGAVCKATNSSRTRTGKSRKCHKAVAPAQSPSAGAGPTQKVVSNGGTTESVVELSPGLSPQQASDQREKTKELMAKSDADLKKVAEKDLSAGQQDTVNQIKSYLEQANQALTEGDVQRGHSLAVKANLLSTELATH